MPKADKNPVWTVPLSVAQEEALEKAIRQYRRNTGDPLSNAEAMRRGARLFVAQQGIKWPEPTTKGPSK